MNRDVQRVRVEMSRKPAEHPYNRDPIGQIIANPEQAVRTRMAQASSHGIPFQLLLIILLHVIT